MAFVAVILKSEETFVLDHSYLIHPNEDCAISAKLQMTVLPNRMKQVATEGEKFNMSFD